MDTSNPTTPLSMEFISKLPKIEIHAHLNGSIRFSTLRELSLSKGLPFAFEEHSNRDLPACFSIFGQIHKVMVDLPSVRRVAHEMLEDFSLQNVIYLEIRTTPKSLEGFFTYEDYLETVLGEILDFNEKNKGMVVRLLLSVDRSRTVEQAWKTLELLEKFRAIPKYSQFILGMDYSGNPYKNSFRDFLAVFSEARRKGFKTMIHIAETEGEDCKQETREILEFGPDRLGHFNYFNEELLQLLLQKQIPLEVCPSSNLCTVGMKSLKEHHFGRLLKEKYPMSLCTDDTGVFDTNLGKEMLEMFTSFEMKFEEVKDFILRSAQCVPEEGVRKFVEEQFSDFFDKF